MLKTFDDLFPDELLNPELSSLDAFCLDSTLPPPAAHSSQAAVKTSTPGSSHACPVPSLLCKAVTTVNPASTPSPHLHCNSELLIV